MREIETQLDISYHQTVSSSTRTGFHPVELLTKKGLMDISKTQAVDKITGCSPQTDGKAPLLRTAPTQLTEHGKVELVPAQNFRPQVLVSITRKQTLQSTKS